MDENRQTLQCDIEYRYKHVPGNKHHLIQVARWYFDSKGIETREENDTLKIIL